MRLTVLDRFWLTINNKQKITQRFWSKVNKNGKYPEKDACKVHPEIRGTRCYEWKSGRNALGYGLFGKHTLASRFAYLMYHGKRSLDGLGPDGRPWIVCHKCDNASCIREEHLFKGTRQNNVTDCVNKGRASGGINLGYYNGNSKLKENDVIRIKKLYATGKYSQRELGKRFKVSYVTVGCLVRGKGWLHLLEDV